MRFLSLISLSILLMAGCQDDEELVPAPCEDPSYRYIVFYSFDYGNSEINPKWAFYTNETATPRGVYTTPIGYSSARILDDACEEINDVTAISSRFNNTTGEYGSIRINTFADVPYGSRIYQTNEPRFAGSGHRNTSSVLTISDVTTPVATVFIGAYNSDLSFEYFPEREEVEIYYPPALSSEANHWLQISLEGESFYRCREFNPGYLDNSTPYSLTTFSDLLTFETMELEHDLPLSGRYYLYGLDDEFAIRHAKLTEGDIDNNTIQVLRTGTYERYLLKIDAEDEDYSWEYANVLSDLPASIPLNPEGTSVSYTGNYPNYATTSQNADLVQLDFSHYYSDDHVGYYWNIFLPGEAQQSFVIPKFTEEMLTKLPLLGEMEYDLRIKVSAYQYFNYEGYTAIQPYLFDIQPDELLNFRSSYVKVSIKP